MAANQLCAKRILFLSERLSYTEKVMFMNAMPRFGENRPLRNGEVSEYMTVYANDTKHLDYSLIGKLIKNRYNETFLCNVTELEFAYLTEKLNQIIHMLNLEGRKIENDSSSLPAKTKSKRPSPRSRVSDTPAPSQESYVSHSPPFVSPSSDDSADPPLIVTGKRNRSTELSDLVKSSKRLAVSQNTRSPATQLPDGDLYGTSARNVTIQNAGSMSERRIPDRYRSTTQKVLNLHSKLDDFHGIRVNTC